MDTEILVEERFEDGQRLIGELMRDGFDVTAAFWVRESGVGSWWLYIGSTAVDPESIGDAYGHLYSCLNLLPDLSISLSDVRLVPASDPAVKAVLALRDRQRGRLPVRVKERQLGKLSAEEAYIYPRGGPMSPDEVMQTVLSLMKRVGRIQPSQVTLQDGEVLEAIPTGIQARHPGGVQVVLLDVRTNAQRAVGADEITNIQ